MSTNKTVALSVLGWLQSQNDDSLKAAIAAVEKSFDVQDTDFLDCSYYPAELSAIHEAGVEKLELKTAGENYSVAKSDPNFEVFVKAVTDKGFFKDVTEGSMDYLQRQAKLTRKFLDKSRAVPDAASNEADAEVKKSDGNAAMTKKDFPTAIAAYTEALDLSPAGPSSHVYYSNRAAAHCSLQNYKSAIADCEASIALEPSFAKAAARLGLANYFEGNYADSVTAYEKAVDLEPSNKSSADALNKARNKLKKQSAPAGGDAMAGGMPDMAALQGMMGGMGGGGGGGGGPGGLGDMLNNPNMMAMAQQMMQNPNMMAKAQEMMKDPDMMQKAMSMMGGAGGGAGGMPDMAALQGMLGGAGAPGASSSGSSSSGSGGGGDGKFKGFDA